MTTIYGVNCSMGFEGGDEYHPTKKAALVSARWWADRHDRDEEIIVRAYGVSKMPIRELLAAIANQKGWSSSQTIVARIKGKADR